MDTTAQTRQETEKTRPRFKTHVSRWNVFVKRAFDILVSFTCLLLFSPIFLVVMVLLKLEQPGPVFFHGLRAGRGGGIFRILKFRTMRDDPENQNGPRITASDDRRITRLGGWLRDSKLNEFPQFWNVLKGEMSLVGPRPEDPEIVKNWPEETRWEILSMRPGITSPASVIYRREEAILSSENLMQDYLSKIMPDKLRLDQLYVRSHNFLSDIDVLVWTLVALFPRRDGGAMKENLLYTGPIWNFVRRTLGWFFIDFVVGLASAGMVGGIWRLSGPLNVGWTFAISMAAGVSALFSVINSLMGLRRISWRNASPIHLFDLGISITLVMVLVFIGRSFIPKLAKVPETLLILTGLVAFIGFAAVRYRQRLITGLASRWLLARVEKNIIGERVLIVGAGDCGKLANWLLQKSELANAFHVVGMVDDDPQKFNLIIDGHRILGTTRDIPEIVKRMNIGVILYAISKINETERKRILELCKAQKVRLVVIPDVIHILQEQFLRPIEGAS